MTTALTRFEPFDNVLSLRDAMEGLLEDAFVRPLSWFGIRNDANAMPLDLYETDEAYVVTAFLPGVTADKLDVSVQQNILSICGEATVAQPEGAHALIKERGDGAFERSIRLPAPVEADKVEAKLSGGVLTITLPKADTFKPRRISIKAA